MRHVFFRTVPLHVQTCFVLEVTVGYQICQNGICYIFTLPSDGQTAVYYIRHCDPKRR